MNMTYIYEYADEFGINSVLQVLSLIWYLHIVWNSLGPGARDFKTTTGHAYGLEVQWFVTVLAIHRGILQKLCNVHMPKGSLLPSYNVSSRKQWINTKSGWKSGSSLGAIKILEQKLEGGMFYFPNLSAGIRASDQAKINSSVVAASHRPQRGWMWVPCSGIHEVCIDPSHWDPLLASPLALGNYICWRCCE